MAIPFGATLGNAFEKRVGGRQWRTDLVAPNDCALECFKRGDLTDADVPIAVAPRAGGRIRRPHFGHDQQHDQQHRNDGTARGNREPEQRDGPLFTHRLPLNKLDEALNMTRDRPDGFLKALIMM